MGYGYQYIPSEPIETQEVLPNPITVSTIMREVYDLTVKTVAWYAMDNQYGSAEDAIILVEDTFEGPNVQKLDIIEEIYRLEESGDWEVHLE